jgi:hypothetical protein
MAHDTRSLFIIACCVQLVLLALPAQANFGEIVETAGHWKVLRSLHAVTDEPGCVAIYEDRFEIKLDENDLFLSLRGRGDVSSVSLQFDDKPAKDSRPASELEKSTGAVNLRGAEFEELLAAKHLKARIRTTAGTTIEEDLDLDGLEKARRALMGSQCRSESGH